MVFGGLYLGRRRYQMSRGPARLRITNIYDVVVFLLESTDRRVRPRRLRQSSRSRLLRRRLLLHPHQLHLQLPSGENESRQEAMRYNPAPAEHASGLAR